MTAEHQTVVRAIAGAAAAAAMLFIDGSDSNLIATNEQYHQKQPAMYEESIFFSS